MIDSHKLSIAHLTKRFRDLEVLHDISVDVPQGEFLGIVGPSGCGKTTFLRIVDGLEPADQREIRIDGRITT